MRGQVLCGAAETTHSSQVVTDLHDYDGGAMSTCQEATLGVLAGCVDPLGEELTGSCRDKCVRHPNAGRVADVVEKLRPFEAVRVSLSLDRS